jgi:hypothetical protein
MGPAHPEPVEGRFGCVEGVRQGQARAAPHAARDVAPSGGAAAGVVGGGLTWYGLTAVGAMPTLTTC